MHTDRGIPVPFQKVHGNTNHWCILFMSYDWLGQMNAFSNKLNRFSWFLTKFNKCLNIVEFGFNVWIPWFGPQRLFYRALVNELVINQHRICPLPPPPTRLKYIYIGNVSKGWASSVCVTKWIRFCVPFRVSDTLTLYSVPRVVPSLTAIPAWIRPISSDLGS